MSICLAARSAWIVPCASTRVMAGDWMWICVKLCGFGGSRVRARGLGAEHFGVALYRVNDGIERCPCERNKIGVEKPRRCVRLRIAFGIQAYRIAVLNRPVSCGILGQYEIDICVHGASPCEEKAGRRGTIPPLCF